MVTKEKIMGSNYFRIGEKTITNSEKTEQRKNKRITVASISLVMLSLMGAYIALVAKFFALIMTL